MAGRKVKNGSSGKESIPETGNATIETSGEDVTADIKTTSGTDQNNKTDVAKETKSASTAKEQSQPTPLAPRRIRLFGWLAVAALFLAVASAGLAGFSFIQTTRIATQQDEILNRLELLDRRVAEMAEATLLQEQAKELSNFGIRLDDVTAEIDRALEQIDAMGKMIAEQLAEPGLELISSLQKRLDEIDKSLSALNSNTETPASRKTDSAGGLNSETGQEQDQRSRNPSPSASEEKPSAEVDLPADEKLSGWVDWIKDLIRIERIENSE
ncbi:hypothetical protein AB8880_10425 [Alphaproteobacteria bacterium LSUCC0684]